VPSLVSWSCALLPSPLFSFASANRDYFDIDCRSSRLALVQPRLRRTSRTARVTALLPHRHRNHSSTSAPTTMQHPQPEAAYPEFPPQMQSPHPHPHNFQQQEMITGHAVDSRPSQHADQSTNATAARNPYGIPITMDQRFPANSASTLSQRCPQYLGSAPGPLTGIPHLPYFPPAGFAQGNNYIGVLNIESPTRPRQSKKRKRAGGASPSRKRKGKYDISHKEVY